jgi:hypothetical protein
MDSEIGLPGKGARKSGASSRSARRKWRWVITLHGNRRVKDEDVKKVFSAIKYNLIEDSEAVNEWRQAVKNLMQNADAELPQ